MRAWLWGEPEAKLSSKCKTFQIEHGVLRVGHAVERGAWRKGGGVGEPRERESRGKAAMKRSLDIFMTRS